MGEENVAVAQPHGQSSHGNRPVFSTVGGANGIPDNPANVTINNIKLMKRWSGLIRNRLN